MTDRPLVSSKIDDQVFEKAYLIMFYNTNFLLNVSILLTLLLPLFFIKIIRNDLDDRFIASSLFVIFSYAFFYNVIYIINDIIDQKKDRAQKNYKLNIFSESDVDKKSYFLSYLACVSFLLLMTYEFYHASFLISLGYFCILAFVSVIHSNFQKVKIVTLYVERWMRLCLPFLAIRSLTHDSLNYFLTVCLFAPIMINGGYRHYVTKKLKLDVKYGYLMHAIYFGCFISIFILSGFTYAAGIPFLLGTFIAVQSLLEIANIYLSKFIKIEPKYSLFKTTSDMKNKLLVRFFTNVFLVIAVLLYANIGFLPHNP
jgi:hypothetical protein